MENLVIATGRPMACIEERWTVAPLASNHMAAPFDRPSRVGAGARRPVFRHGGIPGGGGGSVYSIEDPGYSMGCGRPTKSQIAI
jgi:hypothetical protein